VSRRSRRIAIIVAALAALFLGPQFVDPVMKAVVLFQEHNEAVQDIPDDL
jgi:capsule polysaccharide export protein KpsC/LpsZ